MSYSIRDCSKKKNLIEGPSQNKIKREELMILTKRQLKQSLEAKEGRVELV